MDTNRLHAARADMIDVDLFAGTGGWEEGARAAGHTGPIVGIEWDEAACRAAVAAGHERICADVATYPLEEFAGRVRLLLASPPCQSFSQAGKRRGLQDPRGELVWQPLRWATALRPQWVACEQVPQVLPIWREQAAALEALGYRTWTGTLNSADFGVPQVRKRAILLARLDGVTPTAPEPTHADGDGDLFSPTAPWVTMADALGWGMTARPYFTLAAARTTGGPDKEKVGGSGARKALYRERDEGRWINPQVPELDGAIRVQVDEAAVLQGFRRDYPWQGTLTQRYRQLSNAVPPPMAAAILRPLIASSSSVRAA